MNTSAFRKLPALLALTAALGGCASAPPLSYYTLSPQPGSAAAVQPVVPRIDVQPVSVPAAVDRQELVVRQGPGSLALLENDRWSAPLSDELRNALAADLARRLGAQDVSGLPASANGGLLRVRVAVRSFDSTPGRSASLVADWNLSWPGKDAPADLTCSSALSAPAGSRPADLVLAHQRLLDTLAARIESAVRARAAKADAACPAG